MSENANLSIYERVKNVPDNAKKPINGGRLKGMTDINPMWRIKTLTEIFGVCGIGWKPEIKNKSIIDGANGEKIAVVDIDLYIKQDGVWSDPIPGTGGAMFVENERAGVHTSDEAFKMAFTDAISVSCKLLGFGADVYWNADDDKYSRCGKGNDPPKPEDKNGVIFCKSCKKAIVPKKFNGTVYTPEQQAEGTTKKYGSPLCWSCAKAMAEAIASEEQNGVPVNGDGAAI